MLGNLFSNLFSGIIKKIFYAVIIVLGGSYLISNYEGTDTDNDQLTISEVLEDKDASVGTKVGILVDKLIANTKKLFSKVSEDIKEKAREEMNTKKMKRLFSDGELRNLQAETGFPATNEDVVPRNGRYSIQKGENTVVFDLRSIEHENEYVAGKITMYYNDEEGVSAYYIYCGGSTYAVYDKVEDIGQSPACYFFMRPDRDSFIWYISGSSYEANYARDI